LKDLSAFWQSNRENVRDQQENLQAGIEHFCKRRGISANSQGEKGEREIGQKV
jgi:hypothetical protein